MRKDRRGTLINQIKAAPLSRLTLDSYLQLSRGERISLTRSEKHAEGLRFVYWENWWRKTCMNRLCSSPGGEAWLRQVPRGCRPPFPQSLAS